MKGVKKAVMEGVKVKEAAAKVKNLKISKKVGE
jgi:hypothetical protein